jgi:hypothetical protein
MNRRLRNYVLTAAAFLALVIAITAISIKPTGAQSPKVDSVRVVNTASDWVAPVPTQAQGVTNVGGTIQAQQSGAWNVGLTGVPTVAATQNGAWNVGISGTPTVNLAPGTSVGISGTPSISLASGANVGINNTAANPVLVRNVDSPAPSTTLVFNSGVVSIPNQAGSTTLGAADVSAHSQIRVVVASNCGFNNVSPNSLAVRLFTSEGGQPVGRLDELYPCQPPVTRLIDLPGKVLSVVVFQESALNNQQSVQVVIYGR